MKKIRMTKIQKYLKLDLLRVLLDVISFSQYFPGVSTWLSFKHRFLKTYFTDLIGDFSERVE